MSTNDTIIGIDLGTTFSAVGVVQREGHPVILPNKQERIMPSVVGLSPQGEWLVGTPALNQWVLAPEATVRSIKRDMGTDRTVTLGEHTFTPQEISAFILRELKRVAEVNLGHPVKRAVITVPAYFSDAARQATKDAGQIAGLEVMRIINEPTAAALAYGLDREGDQVVLVYDLGGGTFDVSLVELVGGVVEVRASHGNTRLGGDDFDALLADHLRQAFEKQHGVDLRNDRRAMARLVRAAEKAKIELSSRPFAWVREEYLAEKQGKPLHLEVEVNRHEFEQMIESLIGSTSLFQEKARLMQRRIIAPALETEIDRTGRIGIPPTLREFAGLRKECIILCIQSYIEIWDEKAYLAYLTENEDRFKEAAEEIGNKIAL